MNREAIRGIKAGILGAALGMLLAYLAGRRDRR